MVVIIGQRFSRQIAPRLLTVPNTHSFGDLLYQNILLQQLLSKRGTADFQTFTVLQYCHEPDTHAQLPGSGAPIGRYFNTSPIQREHKLNKFYHCYWHESYCCQHC